MSKTTEVKYGPYQHKGRWRYHVVSYVNGKRTRRYEPADPPAGWRRLKPIAKEKKRWLYQRQHTRPAPSRGGSAGGPRHRELVDQFITAGALTRGFARTLRWLGFETSLRPDAWQIDTDTKTLTVYEVVVTTNLDPDRRKRYRGLLDALVSGGWIVALYRVDRNGNAKPCTLNDD